MIRINEFNPSVSNTKNPQAKCKVIVNNISGTSQNGTEAKLPENPVNQMQPVIYPPDVDDAAYLELYKHLAIAFSNILKSNNQKLVANIIDMSGKVILSADDLVDAISLITGIDRNLITISYEDPDVGCLGKVSPIKQITAIKANGYDFMLGYNKQYNLLSSMFSVSLTKILLF